MERRVESRERMESRVWLRGLWEMTKEAICQKILTYHLPSSPSFRPNQFSGLTVIVTGATSGIGLHTARELAMAGAHVVMACRNIKAADEVLRSWREEARDQRAVNVDIMALDLLSLSSVRSFADKWEKRAEPLHLLINNAGAFFMKEPHRLSSDGIEQHMQVNHIAPALLTLLLLPSLLKADSSRIINVNSVAHHCAVVAPRRWTVNIKDQDFSDMRAYGESKLAQLMFLKTLAEKLAEKKVASIKCIAVNPGIVNTKLVRQVPITEWKVFWMLDPVQGARSVLFCVTSTGTEENLNDAGFEYYSSACKPAKISPQAMDVEACKVVWQKTLEILHLDVEYLTQVLDG